MSRPERPSPDYVPLIAVVHRLNKALQLDMVRAAHRYGFVGGKNSHNAVFATLDADGGRVSDMAAQMGITRQSMGEVIRDMVRLGLLEMVPDPSDKRAKVVTYTAYGKEVAQAGYDHIIAVEERLREEFGEDDLATTRRVLRRVREMLAPAPE